MRIPFLILFILSLFVTTKAYSSAEGRGDPVSVAGGSLFVKVSTNKGQLWDTSAGAVKETLPDLILCSDYKGTRCWTTVCTNSYYCTFGNLKLGTVDWKKGGTVRAFVFDKDGFSGNDRIGSVSCKVLPRKGKVLSCSKSGSIMSVELKINLNQEKTYH